VNARRLPPTFLPFRAQAGVLQTCPTFIDQRVGLNDRVRAMFHLHATKKLLDRIKPEICPSGESDTALGNWYATALFWKPQVALLVSEKTLLPVLMPLAPAATLGRRFPVQLGLVLKEHGIPADFIAQEVWRMNEVRYAKTANRSVVGILSEFSRQAEFWLTAYGYEKSDDDDLLAISAKLILMLAESSTVLRTPRASSARWSQKPSYPAS
jgi:hypothetical protein